MRTVALFLLAIAMASTVGRGATQADLDTVQERVRSDLWSSIPSATTINGYVSSLAGDGSWADVNYADTSITNWNPRTHVLRLSSMARALTSSSHALYNDPTLETALWKAYDYWFSRGSTSSNWWYNDIGAPQSIGEVMVLVEGRANFTSARQTLASNVIMTKAYRTRTSTDSTYTGQNRVWRSVIALNNALATNNPTLANEEVLSIGDTVVVTTGEGIQKDGSFYQHGKQLYNGGYGLGFSNDVIRVASFGAGTGLAFSQAQNRILIDYLADGQRWFIRGNTFDWTAQGRELSRTGQASKGLINATVQRAQSLDPTYRAAELQQFKNALDAASSLGQADTTKELVGNRSFYRADYMSHRRAAYMASVKTVSTRTLRAESINNENIRNYYLNDGVTLFYRSGNEYDDIFPVWNWRKLPGTTAEQNTSLSLKISSAPAGNTSFVGGASNGMYGLHAMDYSHNTVTAKKSWFFFDNEIIALGAGINAPSATAPVVTTLNQTLKNGVATYSTAGGGTQTLTSGSVTPANLKWVHHDGIGYLFMTPTNAATIDQQTQSGAWYDINQTQGYSTTPINKDVFTVSINHGAATSNGSYAYAVLPDKAAAEMDAYYASMPFAVLRNDTSVQAVEQAQLKMIQAVFFTPDTIAASSGLVVQADKAALVMVEQNGNTYTVSASNPLQTALTLNVDLTIPTASASDAPAGSIPAHFTFNFTTGDSAGSTMASSVTVPEPASLGLIAAVLGLLLRQPLRR